MRMGEALSQDGISGKSLSDFDRRLFAAFVREPASLAYRVLGFGETTPQTK